MAEALAEALAEVYTEEEVQAVVRVQVLVPTPRIHLTKTLSLRPGTPVLTSQLTGQVCRFLVNSKLCTGGYRRCRMQYP